MSGPPLHDPTLMGPDDWYACHQPERSGGLGSLIVYEPRCNGCVLHAIADLILFGDIRMNVLDGSDPDDYPDGVWVRHVAEGRWLPQGADA